MKTLKEQFRADNALMAKATADMRASPDMQANKTGMAVFALLRRGERLSKVTLLAELKRLAVKADALQREFFEGACDAITAARPSVPTRAVPKRSK